MTDFTITPIQDSDRAWLRQFWTDHWGAPVMVSRGQVHHVDDLPGFIARSPDAEQIGTATYNLAEGRQGLECELTSLDSLAEGKGVGSALIEAVRTAAVLADCSRLWLITTNDNLHALRFYQRRGFRLAAVHAGAVAQSRRLKPTIPETGIDGIPLRDEIELEIPLANLSSSFCEVSGDNSGKPKAAHPSSRGSSPAGIRLARRPIYESSWINLYLDHIRLPSGREIPEFHFVDYPTASVAAYITNDQGEVLMGQYYRYPVGEMCWEVPAGRIEPGEDVCAAAQREVFEETGYTSRDYSLFYSYYPTIGGTNKLFHLVRGVAGERTGSHDPHELAEIAWFSVPQLRQLIRQGLLTDGLTLTALLIAWEMGF